ncbi:MULTISPECIES: hypothetical protein [unclassified Brenneria]|uniref:hypothetical protein n=1 Tax=unclassified Brenneria TaxID=2634434 RepID=UPI0018F0C5A1|nr:hypothetical protein [Brenneria sp. L3-3C-1]MBJ7223912.1 hypothetical protein [Brenneria sp. L3-3C-1]MEE3645156.1 hypothetical protein [Brenneria sp. L3_3C_1]
MGLISNGVNNRKISKFLHRNSLLSLCTYSQDDFWPASCLFKFNEKSMSLWVSTNENTRHSKIMTVNNSVVGTINSTSLFLPFKRGVQYKGRISKLDGKQLSIAKGEYLKKFPFFKNKVKCIWEIELDEIKYTDLRMGAIQVAVWLRSNDKYYYG